MVKLKVDDPVSAVPVHFFGGIWGLIAVGLFGEEEVNEGLSKFNGIFKGGPFSFLGYQMVGALSVIIWSSITTVLEVSLRLFSKRYSNPVCFILWCICNYKPKTSVDIFSFVKEFYKKVYLPTDKYKTPSTHRPINHKCVDNC